MQRRTPFGRSNQGEAQGGSMSGANGEYTEGTTGGHARRRALWVVSKKGGDAICGGAWVAAETIEQDQGGNRHRE